MNKSLLLVLCLTACGPEAVEPLVTGEVPAPAPAQQEALTGFPCEVREVLQARCASCHAGAVYLPGFETREQLSAPGAAERFTERLQPGSAQPMPPAGAEAKLDEAERSVLLGWLAAGTPAGSCGALVR